MQRRIKVGLTAIIRLIDSNLALHDSLAAKVVSMIRTASAAMLLLIVLTQSGFAQQLKTAKERVSYGFGLNMGRGMMRDGLLLDDVDFNLLVAGLRDAMNDKPLAITEEEFRDAFQAAIAPKLEARAKERMEKFKKQGDINKKEGEAFLAANKAKPGVKTTASGLQYKVLKQGTGKSPKLTDVVRAKYKGTFITGDVFDESAEPAEFQVNKVIAGWTEALQLMKVGDKLQLYVPSALAYGDAGFAPEIAPNTVLIFEVELVEIADATAKPKAP